MNYTGKPVYETRPIERMKTGLRPTVNYRLLRYESVALPRMDLASCHSSPNHNQAAPVRIT